MFFVACSPASASSANEIVRGSMAKLFHDAQTDRKWEVLSYRTAPAQRCLIVLLESSTRRFIVLLEHVEVSREHSTRTSGVLGHRVSFRPSRLADHWAVHLGPRGALACGQETGRRIWGRGADVQHRIVLHSSFQFDKLHFFLLFLLDHPACRTTSWPGCW